MESREKGEDSNDVICVVEESEERSRQRDRKVESFEGCIPYFICISEWRHTEEANNSLRYVFSKPI